MAGINREYRDRLFKFIFGNEENKDWTISLYNALRWPDSKEADAESITFNTIEDVLYMGMKNDVSFLVGDCITFFEQQAKYNPNMPMRFFIYAAMVYQKYIQDKENVFNMYSPTLQRAPSPRCVCFYNGNSEIDDCTVLKLSDAFGGKSDIEVNVTLLNINYGRNKDLLDRCKPLKEYSWFTTTVTEKQNEGMSHGEAVNAALDEMPDDFLIKKFLILNRVEVKDMCLTEYDEEWYRSMDRAESLAEGKAIGREEGKEEGTIKTLFGLVHDGLITEEKAAEKANVSVAEFRKLAAQYS